MPNWLDRSIWNLACGFVDKSHIAWAIYFLGIWELFGKTFLFLALSKNKLASALQNTKIEPFRKNQVKIPTGILTPCIQSFSNFWTKKTFDLSPRIPLYCKLRPSASWGTAMPVHTLQLSRETGFPLPRSIVTRAEQWYDYYLNFEHFDVYRFESE